MATRDELDTEIAADEQVVDAVVAHIGDLDSIIADLKAKQASGQDFTDEINRLSAGRQKLSTAAQSASDASTPPADSASPSQP
jgi:hypothetical protein